MSRHPGTPPSFSCMFLDDCCHIAFVFISCVIWSSACYLILVYASSVAGRPVFPAIFRKSSICLIFIC